jgi:F0F1-type ATP synthase membrane subunit c/vacuolar-type H+-ATPase subunit K
MEPNSETELKRGYRQARFIGTAMVFGVLVYALVVEIMRNNSAFSREPLLPDAAESIKYMFLGLALIQFFLIRMIRRRFLLREPGQATRLQTGLQTGSVSIKVARLLVTSIITYALCESIAVYGLVLYFVTKRPFDFYLFMGISLLYFAAYFPRYTQWEEWVVRGEGTN